MSLITNLKKAFTENKIPINKKIAIAVSGGPDSLALINLLSEFIPKKYLVAFTIDHKLRTESTEEADYVHNLLSQNDIKHYIITWEHDKINSSLQEKARKKRYELLINACKEHKCHYLLTAHTFDDQAETIMQRIIKASGIQGLGGIRPISLRDDVVLFRPLLDIRKNELIIYLKEKNIKYISDPSNEDNKYNRIQVRKFLNENKYFDLENDLFKNRLVKIAQNMQSECDLVEYYLQQEIQNIISYDNLGIIFIDYIKFKKIPFAMQLRIFEYAINYITPNKKIDRYDQFQSIIKQIINNSKSIKLCFNETIITSDNHKIFIYREHSKIPDDKIILSKNDIYIWDNRIKIKYKSNAQNKKFYISKIDYNKEAIAIRSNLKQKKIPKDIFLTLPAIYKDQHLVAIPTINYFSNIKLKSFFQIIF